MLVSAIVPPPNLTLRVLVGEAATERLPDGSAGEVLRGNKFQPTRCRPSSDAIIAARSGSKDVSAEGAEDAAECVLATGPLASVSTPGSEATICRRAVGVAPFGGRPRADTEKASADADSASAAAATSAEAV